MYRRPFRRKLDKTFACKRTKNKQSTAVGNKNVFSEQKHLRFYLIIWGDVFFRFFSHLEFDREIGFDEKISRYNTTVVETEININIDFYFRFYNSNSITPTNFLSCVTVHVFLGVYLKKKKTLDRQRKRNRNNRRYPSLRFARVRLRKFRNLFGKR